MFVGVSKNLGNGFRIGIATQIMSNSTTKELKSKEFQSFLQQVQIDMNNALKTFIEANGKNYKELVKSQEDLDEVFSNTPYYKDFSSLYASVKNEIEKIIYSGDTGVVAKRTITDNIFELKNFIKSRYPTTSIPVEKKKSNIFVKLLKVILYMVGAFVLLVIMVAIFSDSPSKQPSTTNNINKELPKATSK